MKTHTYVHCTPLLDNLVKIYTILSVYKTTRGENDCFDSYTDRFRL